MVTTSIIYYTDNCLEPGFAKQVQDLLVKAADGKPIICVSQKPMDFGDVRICVGDIGRSHLSLFAQILRGVEQVKTEYVALAEHDCLYTSEHFNWIPPTRDIFHYNVNHWFVDYNTGVYSYHRRKVLSMMIADTALTLQAAKDKVVMITAGAQIKKGQPGACEYGVCDNRNQYIEYQQILKDFGKEIGSYRAAAFRTELPNLDIRHNVNFSGRRKGKDACNELTYWGEFKNWIKK